MGKLDGRVVLVTGAARGQGAEEARLFAAEGASVVVADVLEDLGAEVAKEIGTRRGFVRLDVTDEAQWTAAADFAEASSASSTPDQQRRHPALQQDREDLARGVHAGRDVNQVGVFLACACACPGSGRPRRHRVNTRASTDCRHGVSGVLCLHEVRRQGPDEGRRLEAARASG